LVKIILNNGFITLENVKNLRFTRERIKPKTFGEVIDKYDVVLEAIRRCHWRGPNIRKNKLQRLRGY
jgi:hypothetical protein